MLRNRRWMRIRTVGLICGLGTVCQFGGCDIGTITTTTTLDGRDAIIQLVRGVILTPIDALITDAINDAFNVDQ